MISKNMVKRFFAEGDDWDEGPETEGGGEEGTEETGEEEDDREEEGGLE